MASLGPSTGLRHPAAVTRDVFVRRYRTTKSRCPAKSHCAWKHRLPAEWTEIMNARKVWKSVSEEAHIMRVIAPRCPENASKTVTKRALTSLGGGRVRSQAKPSPGKPSQAKPGTPSQAKPLQAIAPRSGRPGIPDWHPFPPPPTTHVLQNMSMGARPPNSDLWQSCEVLVLGSKKSPLRGQSHERRCV